MTRIHRGSMMIYCSLQAEFMETKHNGHGMEHLFGNIVVCMYLNRLTIMINYFVGCKI